MRTESLHREFEQALPRIRTHAEIVFRSVVCPHRRADFVGEAIALTWKWWCRLRQQGKKPQHFVSALATFAARAARSGRRVCGQEKAKDALSPRAQQIYRFKVGEFSAFSVPSSDPFSEALRDNTQTPVSDQVAFRLDFPAWLQTFDQRCRRIIEAMASGERTQDLAAMFGVSGSRISQMRREFMDAWLTFVGEC